MVKIDAVKNTVYVGPQDEVRKKEFFVADLNWVNPLEPFLHEEGGQEGAFRATVKVRSTMKDEPATLYPETNHHLSPFLLRGEWGDFRITISGLCLMNRNGLLLPGNPRYSMKETG